MLRARLALLLPLLCSLALAASGCAHYRLGTGTKIPFSSLYVAPVQNHAGLPQAAAIVSAQLRETFLRDGRLTLAASPEEADAVLTVTLASYGRETLTAFLASIDRLVSTPRPEERTHRTRVIYISPLRSLRGYRLCLRK